MLVSDFHYELPQELIAQTPPIVRGTSRMNFTRDVLTVNFGLRHQLTDARILIASIGHELRDPDQARSFIGYLGVQLLY